jgi:DNA-binding CsgD family transcriptional regulator
MDQFVGRNLERARACAWVDRLPHHGGGFVIHGEPGIGKSALTDVAISRVTDRGARVIKITATESEESLTYAALQQILHPFTQRPDFMRTRPRNVLGRAFGTIEGDTPDLFAVGVAVLEVLADVAPETGLLLVVDDAHWMDDSTARVLAFISRRLAEDPVLAIFVVRSGHSSPLLGAGLETIELDALPEDEAIELLRTRRPGLAAIEQQSVLRNAKGNPLGLLELPADFTGGEDGTLAERLRSAFLARVRGVAGPTRALMLLAALNDGDAVWDVEAGGSALGLTDAEIRTALQEAEVTGTVQLGAGRFTFRHPLVRSAIVSSTPENERRSAHSVLAVVFGDDPDRAVWHRAASLVEADEEVASALEDTARRAAQQGDVGVSLRAWKLAARLSSDLVARRRRSLQLAESAMEAGQLDVAAEALSDVDPDALDDVEGGRFALVQLGVDPHVAQPRRLRRIIEQARRIFEAGETDMAIELVLAVGEDLGVGGFGAQDGLSELAQQITAALPESDPRRLVVLATSDPVVYAGRVAQALLSVNAAELSHTTEMLVRVRVNVDADPMLAAVQRRLLDGYRAQGRLRSIALLQPIHTWNEICLADWPEALRAAEEGTRLAEELGFPRWGTSTVIGEGFIAAMRGDHERADALILESERGALAVGANNVLTGVQLTRGVNHLAQGRYDEAFTAFRRSFDPADPSYHPVQAGWSLGDIAEAAAHLGRIDEIRPLFQRNPVQSNPNASSTPWHLMAQAYAAPFLATEPASVEAAYLDALSGVVAAWPTYHARLLIEYGSWLRRQRQIHDARERLRTGRDLADALAMRPWSERARSELRALGADSLPRIPAVWEPLSPQELEVAHLAARGLSNREIGERLFLSHRTVGSHLYLIYPKLGITNRAQLSAALRASPSRD